MLTTLIITLLVYFGWVGGKILARIAPEELAAGKKYFLGLRKILLFFLALTLLFPLLRGNPMWIVPFLLGMAVGFFLQSSYLFLGCALITSWLVSQDLFFMSAVLIFLYGLPYGSMEKSWMKTLFFFPPLLLFLLPSGTLFYQTTLLAFVAGALLVQR